MKKGTEGEEMGDSHNLASQLHLEPADEADLEVLATVHDAAFQGDIPLYGIGPPGYGNFDWQKAMFVNNSYYKLCIGPRIVGGIIVIAQEGDSYLLNTLFIHPDYHGQGVGQQALRLLYQAYPQAKRWTLFTPYRSFRNQRFYEQQGFVKVGEEYITDQPGLVDGFHLYMYEKRPGTPVS